MAKYSLSSTPRDTRLKFYFAGKIAGSDDEPWPELA